jgi:hypothetical protein
VRRPERIREISKPIDVQRARQPNPRQHTDTRSHRSAAMIEGENEQRNNAPDYQTNKWEPGR